MLPPCPEIPAFKENCIVCGKAEADVYCEACDNFRNDAGYCSKKCRKTHAAYHKRTCLNRQPDREREPPDAYFDHLVRCCRGKGAEWEDRKGFRHDGADWWDVADACRRVGGPRFLISLLSKSPRWTNWFLHSFRRALLDGQYDSLRHGNSRFAESMAVGTAVAALGGVKKFVESGWAIDDDDCVAFMRVAMTRCGAGTEHERETWCVAPGVCKGGYWS